MLKLPYTYKLLYKACHLLRLLLPLLAEDRLLVGNSFRSGDKII